MSAPLPPTRPRRAGVLLARAPLLLLLAALLTAVGVRSSLAHLLPFDPRGFPVLLWVFVGILLALLPALLTKHTPLGAASVVTVPILAAATYGASRLDWLRVLKDFGVAEDAALDPLRLALSALALFVLWGLHIVDTAVRMRARAIERGIDPLDGDRASTRTLRRGAQAAGIALLGALGLLGVGHLGILAGNALPTQRAALLAPLAAAALIVGAALWIARGRASDR